MRVCDDSYRGCIAGVGPACDDRDLCRCRCPCVRVRLRGPRGVHSERAGPHRSGNRCRRGVETDAGSRLQRQWPAWPSATRTCRPGCRVSCRPQPVAVQMLRCVLADAAASIVDAEVLVLRRTSNGCDICDALGLHRACRPACSVLPHGQVREFMAKGLQNRGRLHRRDRRCTGSASAKQTPSLTDALSESDVQAAALLVEPLEH
jgi:hypothetical protein